MGKRREPDIFDDNPLIEDFLEWMVSPDGQAAGEVSGLVFATLENASVDAKRRKIIWTDGERLSIEQSAERIRAEHPDRPRELIEISLCSWFEHRVPESGSEHQINELDRLFGPWIRDRERKSRAAKNDREVRTLKHVIPGILNIDPCPGAMRDRLDAFRIADEKIPSIFARGDDCFVAVPDQPAKLVAT